MRFVFGNFPLKSMSIGLTKLLNFGNTNKLSFS